MGSKSTHIFGSTTIELVHGDITEESTGAIVNAANSSLAGGGGVDGAIHRAGGTTIMKECRKFKGCPTGTAVITGAGNLKADFVIHTVGPMYNDGQSGEAELLRSAYMSSLALAVENNVKTLSVPSISTGVYNYPTASAARVALSAVKEFVESDDSIELVRFVLFSERDLEIYEEALRELI